MCALYCCVLLLAVSCSCVHYCVAVCCVLCVFCIVCCWCVLHCVVTQGGRPVHTSKDIVKPSNINKPSKLRSVLLKRLFRTTLSCVDIQEEAAAAVDDGLDIGALGSLTRPGHGGRYRGNVARDLIRGQMKEVCQVLTPYPVPVARTQCSHGNNLAMTICNTLLPHEVWAEAALNRPYFERLFGASEDWCGFWRSCRRETWMREHPLLDFITKYPGLCCPILLHGDDANIDKKGRRTVRVLQWCSAVAAEKSTDKLMLIAVNNSKDVLADHHALAIDTIAAWSFNVAAENKFPMCDHEGVAFKATSHRGRLALDGRQLCAWGAVMVFVGMVGDWKFYYEAFNLEECWLAEEVCMLCFAQKSAGHFCLSDARANAGWTASVRTHTTYVERQLAIGNRLHPFVSILGFHTHSFFEDLLHDDLQGVRLEAVGSAMVDMADDAVFGLHAGDWKARLNGACDVMWQQFSYWLSSRHLSCAVKRFNYHVLGMAKKDDYPKLKAKGVECAVVCAWVAHKAAEIARRHNTLENRMRARMLKAFDDFWEMSRRSAYLPARTCEERCHLERIRVDMLVGFHNCAKLAAERGKFRYNVIPKFHKLDHLVRRAQRTGVSPRVTWTMMQEDQMQHMSRLCGSVHGLALMRAAPCKWLVDFCHRTREFTATCEFA